MRSTVLWFVLVLAACGSAADPTSATRGRPATLVAVIDGDSLELQVDGNRIEVRLDGVNAPEGDECFGDEASAALLDVVEGASLSFEATGRDQFGRTLGYVFANDVLVNRR
ncbi:MAG: hypothetical protein GWN07_38395, partial [Actinobacteria bacterium]|nr:hypothetical protein [Actinomycetota bacterium]NIS37083.1 hypothetical protein [Actinomycetota bacterium]NIU71552.1 hypothetical protein [Actinomycetota bacterium]NIW33502.1 hypothetical protein [Actinomycetota bacterium]NIX25357.1 hypothetical protein [Actinomycetota bacterium]